MLSGSPIDPSLKEPLAPAPAPDVQIVPSDPPLPDEPNYVKRLRKIPQVGHLLVFGSCLIMTMAAAFIKILSQTDPLFIACSRNVIVLLLSYPLFLRNGGWGGLQKTSKTLKFQLAIRAVCSNINLMTMFYAFRHLPLGDCRMISATSPIYVSILGRIFLKEVCGVFEVFVVTFIMFGVLIVMQPPMIFMHLDLGVFSADELQGEHEYENRHFWIAGLVLIGTVFSAISMVASRALKDVDVFVLTTINALVGIAPPILVSVALGSFSLPPPEDVPLILVIGVFSFVGQCLMTLSFKFEEAGIVSLSRKIQDIISAFAIQVIYFGEIPNNLTILGTVIISLCVILSGMRKLFKKNLQEVKFFRTLLCL